MKHWLLKHQQTPTCYLKKSIKPKVRTITKIRIESGKRANTKNTIFYKKKYKRMYSIKILNDIKKLFLWKNCVIFN